MVEDPEPMKTGEKKMLVLMRELADIALLEGKGVLESLVLL